MTDLRIGLSSLCCCALLACASQEASRAESSVPVELGTVRWERNFEAARTRARSDHKPILLLFQEVPG